MRMFPQGAGTYTDASGKWRLRYRPDDPKPWESDKPWELDGPGAVSWHWTLTEVQEAARKRIGERLVPAEDANCPKCVDERLDRGLDPRLKDPHNYLCHHCRCGVDDPSML